jgi:hypothetical protein
MAGEAVAADHGRKPMTPAADRSTQCHGRLTYRWIEHLHIMLNDIDVAQRAPDKSGQSGLLLLRLQLAL